MSDRLPDKLVSLDQVRINRGLEKICKCENRKFVIDPTNRRVTCGSCGAVVDPYEALYEIALNDERKETHNADMVDVQKSRI